MIEAAGGVVWRRGKSGRLKVLLVHRPSHRDWSLPKGKLEPGEAPHDAAQREVEEETGLQCRLGLELPHARYLDRRGRHRLVRYWAMSPLGGRFRPCSEVDRVKWVRLDAAPTMLTYRHDHAVVAGLPARLVLVSSG